jgi:hypothetical protein
MQLTARRAIDNCVQSRRSKRSSVVSGVQIAPFWTALPDIPAGSLCGRRGPPEHGCGSLATTEISGLRELPGGDRLAVAVPGSGARGDRAMSDHDDARPGARKRIPTDVSEQCSADLAPFTSQASAAEESSERARKRLGEAFGNAATRSRGMGPFARRDETVAAELCAATVRAVGR